MKNSRGNATGQNKSMPNSHRPQPQNKDDIDSRSNEEQDTKGDNVTHNKKEVRHNKQEKKSR